MGGTGYKMIRTQALSLRSRLFGGGGSISGALGGIGSVHNVCHSLCVTVVSVLAIFGIGTSILPLMFLQTYQLYFWLAALVFTLASLYFYLKQRRKIARDKNLLLINSGLLIFGLPVDQVNFLSVLVDYMDFFRFIGISLTAAGVFLLIFAKRFQNIWYSPEELEKVSIPTSTSRVSTVQLPKLNVSSALFAIVIGGFLINQYFMYKMGIFDSMKASVGPTTTSAMQTPSKMKLTPYDIALAKERMDKNNDGICDTCGMPLQQCIDSGQIDCNMVNSPQAIGVLGTQHIHADWKIYINGKALDNAFFDPIAMDMSNPNKQTTSSFIHVDKDAPIPEKTGDLIHMHAKNVPLWVFFKSVGMNLTKDSLTLADGKVYKNENGNTLKFYLNGKKVDGLTDYVFQDLDKLLISFGPETDPDIQKQIESITNFAQAH